MYTFLLEVYVGTQVKSLRTVLAVMLSCAMFCERFITLWNFSGLFISINRSLFIFSDKGLKEISFFL